MEKNAFSIRLDALDSLLVRREEIINLASAGQMIKAIKLYREDTGASLADAKAAVERLEQRMRLEGASGRTQPVQEPALTVSFPTHALRGEVERLISHSGKIQAIKWYREQTGLGLREAKDAIDQIADDMQANGVALSRSIADDMQASGVSLPQLATWQAEMARSSLADTASQEMKQEIYTLLLSGEKLRAIKLYRAQTGVGLREAMDAVNEIERTLQ